MLFSTQSVRRKVRKIFTHRILGQGLTNLPSKVNLPENTETGTVIFTVDGDIRLEGGSFEVLIMFPSLAEEIFHFDMISMYVFFSLSLD
jgi:hypothetical protein